MHRIKVAAWRDDKTAPMQVVSGPVGRERVHFEAPAADRLEGEMQRFLDWFNDDTTTEPVLKAALAHLWFVTIHPFADGNKRTSLLAIYTFLGVNGVDYVVPEAEAAAMILSLAASEVSEESLARWIRDNWPRP